MNKLNILRTVLIKNTIDIVLNTNFNCMQLCFNYKLIFILSKLYTQFKQKII